MNNSTDLTNQPAVPADIVGKPVDTSGCYVMKYMHGAGYLCGGSIGELSGATKFSGKELLTPRKEWPAIFGHITVDLFRPVLMTRPHHWNPFKAHGFR